MVMGIPSLDAAHEKVGSITTTVSGYRTDGETEKGEATPAKVTIEAVKIATSTILAGT